MNRQMKRRIRAAVSSTLTLFLIAASLAWATQSESAQPAPKRQKLAAAQPSSADEIGALRLRRHLDPDKLYLRSSVGLVVDKRDGVVLYGKNVDEQRPIASVTKLMTAMVTLDARLPMDERIRIKRADRDRLRGSRSPLAFGTILTRRDMLYVALAASENRAAKALARTYPGGKKAFFKAMNAKATELGMTDTYFRDATGLHSENVSTARDLVKMLRAADHYAFIKKMTTSPRGYVTDRRSGWKVKFFNTNRLVRRSHWDVLLSKTGYIADSGHCLVMEVNIDDRPVYVVLLNSWGKLSKFGDAGRIRQWLTRAQQRLERRLETVANAGG